MFPYQCRCSLDNCFSKFEDNLLPKLPASLLAMFEPSNLQFYLFTHQLLLEVHKQVLQVPFHLSNPFPKKGLLFLCQRQMF